MPDLEDFPTGPENRNKFVRDIVTNIKCEVRDTLDTIYLEYPHTFLDTWGVQMTLNLQAEESSRANPNTSWTPPSAATALFNLNADATLSSAASRIDKMNFFFTVPELRSENRCQEKQRPGGPMLMQSNLKLYDWLYPNLQASAIGQNPYGRYRLGGPFGREVISHQVRFEVVTAGGVTPGWRLVRVDVNQSGTFLTASRTRTHDLTITLGPTELTQQDRLVNGRPVLIRVVGPSRAAAESHFASEIGTAVANGIRLGTLR